MDEKTGRLSQKTLAEMHVGIAYDQGRAAALQNLDDQENPYSRRLEPKQFDAWLDGYRSR